MLEPGFVKEFPYVYLLTRSVRRSKAETGQRR